jgi:hypothetical protein
MPCSTILLHTTTQHLLGPHLKYLCTVFACRNKYGIKRGLDGRVQLRRRSGTWVSVRLDMEVPGAILLRDTKTEQVYALETDSLPQVRHFWSPVIQQDVLCVLWWLLCQYAVAREQCILLWPC